MGAIMGPTLMLFINFALFGVAAIALWAQQNRRKKEGAPQGAQMEGTSG